MSDNAPARALVRAAPEFHQLAQVPPATEWFANLDNANTRRAYRNDLEEFMTFVGLAAPDELRLVTRAHVLAWRRDLEQRALAGSSVRRKLAALSSLFEYLCEANAVTHNPVQGVRRPKVESYEGKTPALGDALKARRDRALLSLLLYHGLRREELSRLTVGDVHLRRGVPHLRVHGKGSKVRYVPLHPATQGRLADYLEASGHAGDKSSPLFRPIRSPRC